MTHSRESTAAREDPLIDAERDRLAYEHRQDELAKDEADGYGALEPPPPVRRLPAVTFVLGALLVGLLFFFAGVEVQKHLGSTPPAPVVQGGPGGDDGIVGGEVIAVRGETLYVREADGTTVKLRTRPDSRVARARPARVDDVRPGQTIVVETGGHGADTVRSLTVIPPRDRRAAP
jgi:hypothetical protein